MANLLFMLLFFLDEVEVGLDAALPDNVISSGGAFPIIVIGILAVVVIVAVVLIVRAVRNGKKGNGK
ncbi:MAG: hypothetical protein K6G81_06615 [Lachnospiraceae bacterium]|nr:hypothetical protein [Lachnospiraceae bacterium]